MIPTQILKPYLPSIAITKKFPGTNAIKNINVYSYTQIGLMLYIAAT